MNFQEGVSMKNGLMCGVAFVIGALPLMAQTAAPSHFDAARIASHIETLSSDAYEGRGPATPGEDKSIAYISAKMAEAGLEPAGDPKAGGARAWTQDVPLLRSSITGTPTISLIEGGTTKALTQGEEIAVRAPLDGSRAVSIKNVPLVFVGYGTTAPEKKWDDFKGVDVKGKLIVVLINDADFETGEGDFGGKAMTYYGRWTYKYEEAARRGAVGTLIVHETDPASYGWATVKNSNTNTMFDIVRERPKASHALPCIRAGFRWREEGRTDAHLQADAAQCQAVDRSEGGQRPNRFAQCRRPGEGHDEA
jgi:hypothetical protein